MYTRMRTFMHALHSRVCQHMCVLANVTEELVGNGYVQLWH